MLKETYLINTDNLKVKEIESTEGDNYVLQLFSTVDSKLRIGEKEISLKAGITTAFAANNGRKLAAEFKNRLEATA